MAIRYVIGGAGFGKSHFIHQYLLGEEKKHPNRKYYVIVPEQINLQVQRELVRMSDNGVIMNVDVLSFLRLAHRTFDALNLKEKLILEDAGKSMMIKKILNHLAPEFTFFKKVSKKVGFTEDMKSLLTEFMQYGVSVEDLSGLIADEGLPQVIKAKLHDVKLVYEAFHNFKKEKYIVAEKMLDELAEWIEKTDYYQNAVFVFDGFTGFTPTQLKVIESLMPRAIDMVFSFTIEEETFHQKSSDFNHLFGLSKKMIGKINEMAIKHSILIEQPFVIRPYFHKGAISVIEKNLFRVKKIKKWLDEENAVSVNLCKNPKEEADFVLIQTLSLIRDKGYRYKEIAVVTADMEEYGELLYNRFEKAGIPAFLDRKKSIIDNPFIEFIRASLMVVSERFSYESVMRYLRSGFSGIWKSHIDVFENHLLAQGIKTEKKFKLPFQYEETNQDYEKIEWIRTKIISKFMPLMEVFCDKKRTVKENTLALCTFLKAHRCEEKLFVMSKRLEEDGESIAAKEYAKCYEIVMGVFEKMIELLGEEFIEIQDYTKILEEGFLEGKAGFIPQGIDRVVIGDWKRTRFFGVKALFFVGINEGKLPQTASKKGILTDRERNRISTRVELAPAVRERIFIDLHYIYMLLSLPTKQLYLSYSSNSSDGKSQRPSYVIEKILSLFQDKKRRNRSKEILSFPMQIRKDGGLSYLLNALKKEEDLKGEALALARYYNDHNHRKFHAMLEGFASKPIGNPIDRQLAKRLYGDVKGSITRLEKFTECPFAHFLTYGLGIKERKEYELRNLELGTLYHQALERFSQKVVAKYQSFAAITETERKELVEGVMQEITGFGYDILLSKASNRYKLQRMKRLIDRTTWALVHQVRAGEFQPSLFEEAFVTENMMGRIDRIDTVLSDYLPDGSLLKEASEEALRKYSKVEYVRVIDYKSGKKSFDMNQVFYGLDLQLITYLKNMVTLVQSVKGHQNNLIIPVGAYYYTMDEPVRKKGEGEESFLKELRLKGFTLEEPFAISLMDQTVAKRQNGQVIFQPSTQSNVIKFATKTDGEPAKGSTLFKKEEMDALISYSGRVIKEKRKEILEGKIGVEPYRLGDEKACEYCKYESICRFKAKVSGYGYRNLKKRSEAELFETIRKKNEEELDEGTARGH